MTWDYKVFPLQIRYHNAIPNWAKLVGLKIRTVHECEGGGFMVDKDQAEVIMAALYSPPTVKAEYPVGSLPTPTHFTIIEGGVWHPWEARKTFKGNDSNAHAIKFSDGSIFDMVNGWRSTAYCEDKTCPWYNQAKHTHEPQVITERLVPQYPDDVHAPAAVKIDENGDLNIVSTDQRIVARNLLERVLYFLDNVDTANTLGIVTDAGTVAADVRKALATEKKELKAPPENIHMMPCLSYHSRILNGKCSNCGWDKDKHI